MQSLIRQLLAESIVLSTIGGVAGVLLSRVALGALLTAELPVPIPITLDAGDPWWRNSTLQRIATRALSRGTPELARPAAVEALLLARGFADRQSIIFALSLLAWQASASGDVDRAGRIWGGVDK